MSARHSASGFDCSALLDGRLYVGSVKAARNTDSLIKLGITHVLSLGGSPPQAAGIVYNTMHFPDSDDDKSLQELQAEVLPEAIKWIDSVLRSSDNSKILIHCQGGINRAPLITTAFIVHHSGVSIDEAFEQVKSARKASRLRRQYKEVLQTYFLSLPNEQKEAK